MADKQYIRIAQVTESDAHAAVRAFHAQVIQPDMALVVFFCASDYDLDALALEMHRLFGDTPVIGCTTAGEIGPVGYGEHGLAGASFSGDAFFAATQVIGGLQEFDITRGQAFVEGLLREMENKAAGADAKNGFAFLLIDGLSMREELVTRTFQSGLGRFPLFGGSAGDGLRFGKTYLYHGGKFHTDSAVLTLVKTSLPIKLFKTQHFVVTEERLVVTDADAGKRVVKEINGRPAASEYARLLGVDVCELNPVRFATSPVVVLIDGANYVRSIQKVNPDGSLTFYCAIEEGLVLRVARGMDLVANLEKAFDTIHADIGQPQLVLSCDCILRSLEVTQTGQRQRVGEIFRENNTIGFATYGEQFGGVHVNQTLTGIAIGNKREIGNA